MMTFVTSMTYGILSSSDDIHYIDAFGILNSSDDIHYIDGIRYTKQW